MTLGFSFDSHGCAHLEIPPHLTRILVQALGGDAAASAAGWGPSIAIPGGLSRRAIPADARAVGLADLAALDSLGAFVPTGEIVTLPVSVA